MKRQYMDPMTRAYGRFPPSSAARAQRAENAARGLLTCHCCTQAFPPAEAVARVYCSADCARADLPAYARKHPRPVDPDGFSVNLIECGCSK